MLLQARHDDAALLARARGGDTSAVAALYELHHADALRLAQLVSGLDDAEDLVSEAFARVLARFRAGGGPSSNFRGYLCAAIRNRCRDLQRAAGREEFVSDQPWLLEQVTAVSEMPDGVEMGRAAAALAGLPPAWRRVLWLIEVEELSIAEVAARLELKPAAVSSLVYRAREGLRTAYLDQRLRSVGATTSECLWVRERLSRYVRAALGAPMACRVESHVAACASCATLLDELERVNRRFRLYRLPASRQRSLPAAAGREVPSGPAGRPSRRRTTAPDHGVGTPLAG